MGTSGKTELNDKRGIQSVDAALEILRALAEAGGAQSLSAMAKTTGNTASTTHRHLVSLQRSGLVVQDALSGWYDLGPQALRLGVAALNRMDAVGIAQAHGAHVAQETGITTFVTVWTQNGPMVIRWFHGRETIITSAGVGAVLPLLKSSAGLMFAAHQPRPVIEPVLRALRPRTSFKDVEGLLRTVRERGYGVIDGQMITELRGMSVPVLNFQSQIECAITVLSSDPALLKLPNKTLQVLLAAGHAASAQLGFMAEATEGTHAPES